MSRRLVSGSERTARRGRLLSPSGQKLPNLPRISALLKEILRAEGDLVVLQESPLIRAIPAIREVAQAHFRGKSWPEARALDHIVRACIEDFVAWASDSTHPRVEAQARIMMLASDLSMKKESVGDLARQLGISRGKLYELKEQALRQISWQFLHYPTTSTFSNSPDTLKL